MEVEHWRRCIFSWQRVASSLQSFTSSFHHTTILRVRSVRREHALI
jgi:hypothetical protein